MTVLVRRVLPLLVLAGLLLYVVVTQQVPRAQSDMWFHLRLGDEFLDGWNLSSPGHLGPFDTADWTPTQWLPQEAMAWLVSHAGLAGVLWAAGALMLLTISLLYASCRELAAPLPSALAVAAGAFAASPGFSPRPQLLSYLFVVITVSAWLATWRDGRPRYWLVPIAWIWPMCHGMWPVGISISVAALTGLFLESRFDHRALLRMAIIPVLSIVVAAATPIGLDSYRTLLVAGSRREYFQEWGATDFTTPHALVLAVMLAVVIAGGLRQTRVPWTHVALVLLATMWILYSLRTTVIGSLIITPILATTLNRLVPTRMPFGRAEKAVVSAMTLIACCALVPLVASRQDTSVVPAWVDSRLQAMATGTRILNDWDTGSYFLYRHPQLAFVMHGYGDVFTGNELERNSDLMHLEPGWDATVEELDVDAALLDPDSPLAYTLEEVLDWDVEETDDSFVLLRPPPSQS